MKISAVIISRNEEGNIGDAIRSLDWADEVLVVDSESDDATRDIASGLGAKVIVQPWLGFSKQKQFGADSAENDWIFSLDADERVSPDLALEIAELKSGNERDLTGGYKIPRLAYYMGQPIRHGGWYPDSQLRLFDRRKGKWKDVLIHESFELGPQASHGRLSSDILHYSIKDAGHHHQMIGERYAPLAARQMFENGRTTSPLGIVSAGPLAFLRSFVLKAGFLDGLAGFSIARFASHHAFLKHLILWELQNGK